MKKQGGAYPHPANWAPFTQLGEGTREVGLWHELPVWGAGGDNSKPYPSKRFPTNVPFG